MTKIDKQPKYQYKYLPFIYKPCKTKIKAGNGIVNFELLRINVSSINVAKNISVCLPRVIEKLR